jgi:hypothetical protein
MSQRREHEALGVSRFGNASRDMHSSQHARNSIVVFTGTSIVPTHRRTSTNTYANVRQG